jgi:large subunit ribosomal protein L5
MKNYKLNEYIAKLPYNNPYNKPELKEVKVIVSNNNVIQNQKLLIPLINTSMGITGQFPKLIKTKKSVASFKLRKGGVVGLLTTLGGVRKENFLKILKVYGLPRLVTNQPTLVNNKLSKLEAGKSLLTFGINNINIFSHITPLVEESLQVSNNPHMGKLTQISSTGGYTQLSQEFKTPYKNLTIKENKNLSTNMHKFFYSLLYFPVK